MVDQKNRFRGALVGLAAGDAVGTTVEFKSRGSFEPVTDMIGGGVFDLDPGQWTDDTSMALCLATSLIESDGFDERDQIERYCKWATEGYLSSTGSCFDIGGTVNDALRRYRATGVPFSGSADPMRAGNGSIMRLAPVVLYYFPDREEAVWFAGQSSRTTHQAPESVDGCIILADVLMSLLEGQPKDASLEATSPLDCSERLAGIASGAYRMKERSEIRGTGYVVDSLEAAFWCFERTYSFEDAVLLAANLGDDADTTAAIVGQLAGAHYGYNSIPGTWRSRVAYRQQIVRLADLLLESSA